MFNRKNMKYLLCNYSTRVSMAWLRQPLQILNFSIERNDSFTIFDCSISRLFLVLEASISCVSCVLPMWISKCTRQSKQTPDLIWSHLFVCDFGALFVVRIKTASSHSAHSRQNTKIDRKSSLVLCFECGIEHFQFLRFTVGLQSTENWNLQPRKTLQH